MGDHIDSRALTPDDRAAARAFVARCEVRLSTCHRIAVGMLSGAGLLVVLPVVARDVASTVLRSLLTGPVGTADVLLTAAVVAMLATPLVALYLLFQDLTTFYFHANKLDFGSSVVTPRFTLTALRIPNDELSSHATEALAGARHDKEAVDLLVPRGDRARRGVDEQLAHYGKVDVSSDADRALGLQELAASRDRSLLEEVAKVEMGMARHVLNLRRLILRYVKALLILLTTAIAVYAADAVAGSADGTLGASHQVALGAVVVIWAPAAALAGITPLRWTDALIHDRGAGTSTLAGDRALMAIERVALPLAVLAWAAATFAVLVAFADRTVDAGGHTLGIGALLVSASVALATFLHGGRHVRRSLSGGISTSAATTTDS